MNALDFDTPWSDRSRRGIPLTHGEQIGIDTSSLDDKDVNAVTAVIQNDHQFVARRELLDELK